MVASTAPWSPPSTALMPVGVAALACAIARPRSATNSIAAFSESTPAPAASPTSATPAPSATLTFDQCAAHSDQLADCGRAPELTGISTWLNTDGDTLSLAGLRGKVVLVDFWTYSCINCQRTLPHLTAWDAKYRADGLTIIGVHAPEFAFERVVGNVADQAAALGVRYPVAIDNDFATWKAYHQRFWPAHYLIDQTGVVRQVHYGEEAYEDTERLIRQLLAQPPSDPATTTSASATLATAPDADVATVRTPEIYLGTARATASRSVVPPARAREVACGTGSCSRVSPTLIPMPTTSAGSRMSKSPPPGTVVISARIPASLRPSTRTSFGHLSVTSTPPAAASPSRTARPASAAR